LYDYSKSINGANLSLFNFDSPLTLPQSTSIATFMGTRMRTRSAAAKKPEEDLTYSMQDALLQMKAEVQKVCAANASTEKKVESFAGYLDVTKAGLISSYVYALFTVLACTGCNTRTEGTRSGSTEGLRITTVHNQ
jgi:hypothetical protein